jgi:hypothetical protein
LICESRDDRGNAIIYEYQSEDHRGIDLSQAHEGNRGDPGRSHRRVNRYLKRIKYGNRNTLLDDSNHRPRFAERILEKADWMFEVVFDYDEGHDPKLPAEFHKSHYLEQKPNSDGQIFIRASATLPDDVDYWPVRKDPFSSYRATFEVRTYRLCRRVLLFHHFPK